MTERSTGPADRKADYEEADQSEFGDPLVGVQDPAHVAELIRTFDVQPALKQVIKYGVFLWWSDRLPAWIHPDDLEIAERLVPGCRVFRREPCEGFSDRQLGYSNLVYGSESFRALPIVWLEIETDGYEVGDQVEVKSGNGKRRPGIAMIVDQIWNRHSKVIEYDLERNGMPLRRPYRADEIRPAQRLGSFLSQREKNLLIRS